MSDIERQYLSDALRAVTTRTPLITRGVLNATKSSYRISHRRQQLTFAINNARALLEDLVARQKALGWPDEGNTV